MKEDGQAFLKNSVDKIEAVIRMAADFLNQFQPGFQYDFNAIIPDSEIAEDAYDSVEKPTSLVGWLVRVSNKIETILAETALLGEEVVGGDKNQSVVFNAKP